MSSVLRFFETEGFMPHGMCLLWKPEVFWLHVVSDGLIALANYSIPFVLMVIVSRRKDLAFSWVFRMFGAFILACGTTHAISIWTMWNPDYGVEALVKLFTAVVSVATAIALWPMLPRALALPSNAQLEAVNANLRSEVSERQRAERALKQLNDDLEHRVADRVAELAMLNRQLEFEIEERKKLESKLVQALKMQALGQLTGGLAHDFNNLLAVIIGNIEAIEPVVSHDLHSRSMLRRAMVAAMRGSELNRKLLAFARRQALHKSVVDIGALVSGTFGMLKPLLGEKIEVELKISTTSTMAETDAAQVEAAVTNIAINARDAMPAGGKLTVTVSNAQLTKDFATTNPDASPGHYVAISIGDTGSGISPEHLERVFEPFFTTKEVGKGSGLGLSMVYGFVKQSGGYVSIDSVVGTGTTVHVYLPAAQGVGAQPAPRATAVAAVESRGATILVVEDNPDVRDMAVNHLSAAGYRTFEAADGPSALEMIKRIASIDLLFTDVIMPGGMNGFELAEEAVRLRPNLKVLFTSGYVDVGANDNGTTSATRIVLNKPYRRDELLAKLRQALTNGNGARKHDVT
ncbi:MAG: ATP-binding protein [Rhodospirillaceae bacterium]|nr:ATP-binding protein [Rhodospirillaceae bacterium]